MLIGHFKRAEAEAEIWPVTEDLSKDTVYSKMTQIFVGRYM